MSRARRDRTYWQRLRRDKLLLPGPQSSHRMTPLYWALLIPFAWWAVNLVNYAPRISKTLVPACLIGPLIAFACLIVGVVSAHGDLTLPVVVALVSLGFAGAGLLFYSRSLLRREGPAR